MSAGERRLAAIMFTDIQGYTAMTQKDEVLALSVLNTYRSLVHPIIPKYGGREIKTMGDGSLVEFGSALEASECAVEMQKVLHRFNESALTKIVLRVGIHVGDVVHSSGDVYGDAVNIASRIEPLAEGGGICISGQVYYQIRNKLPQRAFRIENAKLKNVSYSTEVYRLEMPWEVKGAELEKKSDKRRLAVLPLDNISPDPNDEYFADGLTDELITVLSKVNGLEVIARTSVLRYKGGAKNVTTIGEELNVGSVLEGSVRKAGNKIRVTAQLINTVNEAHIWADTYDRQLDDIFVVQSDIAQKVAESLRLELSAPEKIREQPTQDVEAYTLFLRGKVAAFRTTGESLLKGIDYFNSALRLSPDFALCYAQLAIAWANLGFFEFVPPQDAFPKAKIYARKALELDESIAEGHVALGRLLRVSDWNFEESDKEMRRAIQLEPSSAIAHAYRSQGLVPLNQEEEARAEAKKALELDPFSVLNCSLLGVVQLYVARRYDDALELFERAIEIDPESPFPLGNLGLCYIQKGLIDRGISLLEKCNQIQKRKNPSSMNDLAYAYGKAGRNDDVRKILSELLETRKESSRAATAIAGVYTILGEQNLAFEWLEKAFKEHTPYLVNIDKDFIFDPLRSDARFKELMQRIGIG